MKMGMELEATQSVSGCPCLEVTVSVPVSLTLTEFSLCLQVLDEKLMFLKVHMPWDVLCTYAEVLHIKLPIQPNDMPARPSPLRFFSCITKHFYPDEKLISKESEFFTAPFEKDRQDLFCIKDKDLFFTPSMRSRMVGCSM